jgi:NAD(P)H-hydrate repair Nnr-like enzyme with NAD(P)H-hydrate dehydratase domain
MNMTESIDESVREIDERIVPLLKGATTIVADPDGQVRLNLTGTPWLATGGTGDVLTGMVAAYLAAGLTPLDAASVAAFVHGIAARLASDGSAVTAPDVVAALPDAVRAVSRP